MVEERIGWEMLCGIDIFYSYNCYGVISVRNSYSILYARARKF